MPFCLLNYSIYIKKAAGLVACRKLLIIKIYFLFGSSGWYKKKGQQTWILLAAMKAKNTASEVDMKVLS